MSGIIEARPRVGYFYNGDKKWPACDLLTELTAKDIKSLPVMLREKTSVYDAIVTLFLEDVGTIFVVDDDGYLKGVVSRKDFIKAALGNNNLQDIPIAVIMTRLPHLHMVYEDTTVLEVVRCIVEYEVDSLPVVRMTEDRKYKVVGRVTKTSLARLVLELSGNR